jgi:23S rRNA (cytosine1962-C5)-methyltransferase
MSTPEGPDSVLPDEAALAGSALAGSALAERIAARLDPAAEAAFAARRLLHGRGGTEPGCADLVVDRYGPVLRIGVHGERPADWVRELTAGLEAPAAAAGVEVVLLQWRSRRDAPVEVLLGTAPDALVVTEAGLRYRVRPGLHRNAGLFLDAAPARQRVRALASGARVLNLFAYTCAFSVAALAGGAREVVNLDMAKGALAIGRENHRLNGLDGAAFLGHDLFRSWGGLRRRGPFDLILLDPPSYQRGSFEADRDWPRLLQRLDAMLAPAGRVLACLNSPFHGAAELAAWRQAHAPELAHIETLPPSPDFPERDPLRGLRVELWQRG